MNKIHSGATAKFPKADSSLQPRLRNLVLNRSEINFAVVVVQQIADTIPGRFLAVSAETVFPAVFLEELFIQHRGIIVIQSFFHGSS